MNKQAIHKKMQALENETTSKQASKDANNQTNEQADKQAIDHNM